MFSKTSMQSGLRHKKIWKIKGELDKIKDSPI